MSLWERIVFEKCGEEIGDYFTKPYNKAHGCGMWKAILKHREFFQKHIAFKLGNGQRIRFWEDVWCAAEPLKNLFLSIFKASRNKNRLVGELAVRNSDMSINWDLGISRCFTNLELQVLPLFINCIENVNLKEEEDSMVRRDGNRFIVRNVRRLLNMKRDVRSI